MTLQIGDAEMAVLEILKMGDARLLKPAEDVEQVPSAELDKIITDLIETMRANDGAGLAAPQVGISLNVLVFEVNQNPRYPNAESIPLTVLINPTMKVVDDSLVESWEGCLSIPGMRGLVPRYQAIEYEALSPEGKKIVCQAEGFHATVFQHEFDHLQGVLYPFRIKDARYFGFSDALLNNLHSN